MKTQTTSSRLVSILENDESLVTTASGERIRRVLDAQVVAAIMALPEDSFGWWGEDDERVYDANYEDPLPMMGSGEVWQGVDGVYWFFKTEESVGLVEPTAISV